MRIVCDSNVFISAFLFGGKPQKVILGALQGHFKIFISSPILFEIEQVLKRDKFKLSEKVVLEFVKEIKELAELVTPKEKVTFVDDDPDDNKIIECAVASKSQIIVTGDKHLLNLKNYRGIDMITPDEFLKLTK